jgi:mRNA interferase MazF
MIVRGDIVLLSFPFTDLQSARVRPALVVSTDSFNKVNDDAIFVFITSREYRTPYDVRITSSDPSFKGTGLKVSSTMRVSKLMSLEQKLVRRRLGRADKRLQETLDSALAGLLDL